MHDASVTAVVVLLVSFLVSLTSICSMCLCVCVYSCRYTFLLPNMNSGVQHFTESKFMFKAFEKLSKKKAADLE